MDVNDLHEVTFVWPDLNANEVILTGTFDNWSLSVRLTKTPAGFQGTVKLPWGSRTLYKYVVDGRWMTAQSQPQEIDNAGNVNSIYESPPKPESPASEELANKPIPEVVPDPQSYVSKDHTPPEDVILNVHTSTTPPVVGSEEKTTHTHTEKLVSEGTSEASLSITSLINEAANFAVVGIEKITNSQSRVQEATTLPTKAEVVIEKVPSLKTETTEVVSDKPHDLAEVERVDIASSSDKLPVSVSEGQSVIVLPLTKEAVTSSEATSTSPATQNPIDKSALQTVTETIASDGANMESMETAARVEPGLVPEDAGSLQTSLAVVGPARQPASSSIPSTLGERDVPNPMVQEEESSPSIAQTVSDDSSTSVKNRTSKEGIDGHLSPFTPATFSKVGRRPSSGSMEENTASSANSSKFNSVRKKRLSLFGKVKHLFLHDKDDEKDQK